MFLCLDCFHFYVHTWVKKVVTKLLESMNAEEIWKCNQLWINHSLLENIKETFLILKKYDEKQKLLKLCYVMQKVDQKVYYMLLLC